MDAVIICAATGSSGPVQQAGDIARSRGRVVMVGATGMELPRETYFRKELSFTLSRSYGPGRYDPAYEEKGRDYPIDYVRFTEQRNMESFLDLVKDGRIDPVRLTTHRFALEDAAKAYALLQAQDATRIGIVLTYSNLAPAAAVKQRPAALPTAASGAVSIGLIGTGGYAGGHADAGAQGPAGKSRLFRRPARQPAHAQSFAERFSFAKAAASAGDVINDPSINTVVIATRHDSHATLACAALAAGKHVWVEKPLVLNRDELDQVMAAREAHPGSQLVVGFNRRYSPTMLSAHMAFRSVGARMISLRVNAGRLPANHWTPGYRRGGRPPAR
jgi:hypothetical protein